MVRIQLDDTSMSAVFKMSKGNPGALIVCTSILNEGTEIDPDAALGGLGAILSMDILGIYESKIWMLYKDVCKEDIVKMLAVLRSCQMGMLSKSDLHTAIDNYGKGIDVDDLYKQVKTRLPNFK